MTQNRRQLADESFECAHKVRSVCTKEKHDLINKVGTLLEFDEIEFEGTASSYE